MMDFIFVICLIIAIFYSAYFMVKACKANNTAYLLLAIFWAVMAYGNYLSVIKYS